jgi:hypothetical protein
MGKPSVRCTQCGAKNGESLEQRCRLCGFLLPDHQRRRLAAAGATEGISFAASVEEELGTWASYGANGVPKRQHIFDADGESTGTPLTVVVALVVALVLVLGAAQLLIA